MAAEMSTGAPAVALLADTSASVALLVVGLKAKHEKKVVGESVFTFDDVAGMKAAIDAAAGGDEARVFVARSVGRDRGDEVVAEFEFTWSFKRRRTG
jgi:hypothetical protein